MRRSNSMPFMPGMRMSTSSRSNSDRARISSAAAPEAAWVTLCPSRRRRRAIRSRLVLRSSTTRMRPGSPRRRSAWALDGAGELGRDRQIGVVRARRLGRAPAVLDDGVDLLEQQPGLALHRLDVVGEARRQLGRELLDDQLGIAEDRVDGRAQVVAQPGLRRVALGRGVAARRSAPRAARQARARRRARARDPRSASSGPASRTCSTISS